MRVSPALIGKFNDLLPSYRPTVIFDVGANVGQTCLAFLDAFPEAKVYAFEPVPSTFASLVANTAEHPSIIPNRVALGASSTTVHMTNGSNSKTNRIIPDARRDGHSVEVDMARGDEFCVHHNVDKIGYLKVDAEGKDLDVIVGFQKMLADQRIDIIEAEVGMNRRNMLHVPFEQVKAFLEPIGYSLFYLFEQFPDTKFSGFGYLRRCNAVFASEHVLAVDRQESPSS